MIDDEKAKALLSEDAQLALATIVEHELAREKDATESLNPFRRSGVTAADVAARCGWFTGKVLRSGQCSTPRAKGVLRELETYGFIEEFGRQRTLECGSRTVCVYVTPRRARLLRERRVAKEAGYTTKSKGD